MKKSLLVGIVMLAIAAVAAVVTFNVNRSLKQENNMSLLGLANLEALAQNESGTGGFQTIYKRNDFKCIIYGHGKIQIAGGTILEVRGELAFDGGVYCSEGGSDSCYPTECYQLWHWIFN